jgi:lipoate-protein ligase A
MSQSAGFWLTPNCDPYLNMAVDEWLFGAVADSELGLAAVLRLYTWASSAITIGYNQDPARAVSWSQIDANLPVIRRITGGRAIFHDPYEITFSFCARLEALPEGLQGLSQTNALISMAVVESLREVGISASWARHSDRSFRMAGNSADESCFNSLSKYEIIADGKKIAGGAQRRVGSSLIHQGSLKVNGIQPFPAIGQRAWGDEEIGPVNPAGRYSIDNFRSVFPRVFSSKFRLAFASLAVSPRHEQEIDVLRRNLQQNSLSRRGIL